MTASSGGAARWIGRIRGTEAGGTLLVIAAIHGNEPAGVHASRRVLARIADERLRLRGELACVVGNVGAFARGVRHQGRDLNRVWDGAWLARLRGGSVEPRDAEDAELLELSRTIDDVRDAARGSLAVLDLHTTSSEGPPFSIAVDSHFGRILAQAFPLTSLTGLVELLDGTMVVSLARSGVAAMVVECGQNDAPRSVDHAEAAIWVGLVAAGVVSEAEAPWIVAMREALASARRDLPASIRVIHRQAIQPEDRFRMEPGFRHFQRVEKGRLLATDVRGEVRSPADGYVLLPLYQGLGTDGFFLGEAG